VTMAIKHVLSGVVLVIASAATVSAFAQTPPPATTGTPGAMTGSPGKARPRLKDNKDGQLSRAELKAYRQAHKGERK
jgi:hypothetical protein